MAACPQCAQEIAADALACPHCHALVHADELNCLSEQAKTFEAQGSAGQALEVWRQALPLVPAQSTQAVWILRHLGELNALVASQGVGAGRRFAPATIVSLIAFIALYSKLLGLKLGAGFAIMILLHEMGHYIDIKRRGLPADMPVFLPGLGAYVRWNALGVPLEVRGVISLAGPFAGLLASLACAAVWYQTRDPYWAALARSGAYLNAANLTPVWTLDGGQAASALGKLQRWVLLLTCLLVWPVFGQSLFFLLALGAAWRLFQKDLPSAPSGKVATYFVALLIAFGILLRWLPGTGFGL